MGQMKVSLQNTGEDAEPVPESQDACAIRTPEDHKLMFRTLENPLRRKLIRAIGVGGRTKGELSAELGITGSQLQFQLDYLVKMCFAEVEGENCRLNSKGIDLMRHIK